MPSFVFSMDNLASLPLIFYLLLPLKITQCLKIAIFRWAFKLDIFCDSKTLCPCLSVYFLPVLSFEKLEVIMMIDKLSPTLSCLPMIPTINSTHPHHNTSDSTQFGAATSKHQYHWVTLYHHSKKNQKKMKKARTKNPSFGANGCFLLQIN